MKNPMSSRRIAFLSTEDPGVIAEAQTISSLLELSTDKGWEWYWSEIPRTQPFQGILVSLHFIYVLCRLQWRPGDSATAFREPDGNDHKVAVAAHNGPGVRNVRWNPRCKQAPHRVVFET